MAAPSVETIGVFQAEEKVSTGIAVSGTAVVKAL
jgi:hypothetical protein